MAIQGNRSTFPNVVDDWGEEFLDDVCQIWQPEDWNKIQDAVYNIERFGLRTYLTGQTGILTHAVTGSSRPAILYKVYHITVVGAAAQTKTAMISGFTTAEKTLFGGTPLASGNVVHLDLRRVDQGPHPERAYCASLIAPITDTSGDTGINIKLRNQLQTDTTLITSGLYILTMMISA